MHVSAAEEIFQISWKYLKKKTTDKESFDKILRNNDEFLGRFILETPKSLIKRFLVDFSIILFRSF